MRSDDEGLHVKGLNEPWATKRFDPSASSYWHELMYDGALIERFILVSVDGARADLPLPDRNSLEAEPLAYRVAPMFDRLNNLDEYMERAGLRVRGVA
jgi:hypothetical protein